MAEDHFTFLGYREYDLVIDRDGAGLQVRPDSGLGILRGLPSTVQRSGRKRSGSRWRRSAWS